MNNQFRLLGAFLLAVSSPLTAADLKLPPLPAPLSNNAVASMRSGKDLSIFSFMGIGPNKTWKDISNAAYEMDLATAKWTELRPVPGTVGRLGAVAVAARGQVYVFGGYAVDAQGGEATLSDVNVYVPAQQRWFRGADIPAPVDDSVAGVRNDRFIYLISGWSKTAVTNKVQVYDAEKNTWAEATPIPGTPVFGHAGSVLGDTIIYVDGVRKNPAGGEPAYVTSDECWMGKVDHHDPTKIEWRKIENHPGIARYRIAAGASEKEGKIYFAGGTDNPYNFSGIGYDKRPAEPSPFVFAWDAKAAKWETIADNSPDPTMDHRGLAVAPQGLITVGGMEKGQKVTARVIVLPKSPTH
jgi:N-acetylneuraminic acid mutarotase